MKIKIMVEILPVMGSEKLALMMWKTNGVARNIVNAIENSEVGTVCRFDSLIAPFEVVVAGEG